MTVDLQALFRRAQLKALVDAHGLKEGLGGNLSHDEITVIQGALDLTHKTAADCMTPMDKVFMLPSDAVLEEHTLADIILSGHSRVPVHRPGNRFVWCSSSTHGKSKTGLVTPQMHAHGQTRPWVCLVPIVKCIAG